MATTTISLKEFAGRLKRIGQGPMKEAAIQGLILAALRGKAQLILDIAKQTPQPVDRGTYRGAWQVDPMPEGAILYNNELHAVFIEYGVRGKRVRIGRAMIEALTEWVQRKGLEGDTKEARKRAWAIAKSMRQRGIFNRNGGEGLGILKGLVEGDLPHFVHEEVSRAVRRMFQKNLEG